MSGSPGNSFSTVLATVRMLKKNEDVWMFLFLDIKTAQV